MAQIEMNKLQVSSPKMAKLEQKPIVALNGQMFSGKSTAAKYLTECMNFHSSKIAKPLKDMLLALGLTERHIEGDLKDKPCAILMGKTPRYAMRKLGLDWRDMIHEDLWLHQLTQRPVPADCLGVVVDDLRFENEAEYFARNEYAVTIKIIRPSIYVEPDRYEPEIDTDYTIVNDGTIDDLDRKVWGVLSDWRPRWYG